jgi:hypothetical protein
MTGFTRCRPVSHESAFPVLLTPSWLVSLDAPQMDNGVCAFEGCGCTMRTCFSGHDPCVQVAQTGNNLDADHRFRRPPASGRCGSRMPSVFIHSSTGVPAAGNGAAADTAARFVLQGYGRKLCGFPSWRYCAVGDLIPRQRCGLRALPVRFCYARVLYSRRKGIQVATGQRPIRP